MTAKHTPGPWTVGNPEGTTHYVMVGGHTVIAELPYRHPWSAYAITDTVQREANARLIAAAPELLACLEEIMGMEFQSAFSSDTIDADEYFGERLAGEIRAALAKARGE